MLSPYPMKLNTLWLLPVLPVLQRSTMSNAGANQEELTSQSMPKASRYQTTKLTCQKY
jgi:hypothetical protein